MMLCSTTLPVATSRPSRVWPSPIMMPLPETSVTRPRLKRHPWHARPNQRPEPPRRASVQPFSVHPSAISNRTAGVTACQA